MVEFYCILALYLYLQYAIAVSALKLLKWDDPKWKEFHRKDKPDTRKTFALAWFVITPFVVILDVGLLVTIVPVLAEAEYDHWTRALLTLPLPLTLFAATLAKVQFTRHCWRTWTTERLKERLKSQKD